MRKAYWLLAAATLIGAATVAPASGLSPDGPATRAAGPLQVVRGPVSQGPAPVATSPAPAEATLPGLTPANRAALARSLQARGEIPAGAGDDEIEAAVDAYLQSRAGSGAHMRRGDPLGPRSLQVLEREAAHRHRGRKQGREQARGLGRGPGQGAEVPDFAPGQTPDQPLETDRALVLLVEFAESAGGPEHNRIPPPSDPEMDFWVPDFSPDHYQQLLFGRGGYDPGNGRRYMTMADYFLAQSYGRYNVEGDVTRWVQLPHPESYYGADGDGIDDANGPVWRVVADAVAALGDEVDWQQYDQRDPYDLDGDGVTAEADGYVDRMVVVHAGRGQEAGGGAQGDDAIWSHSWWANFRPGLGPGYGGVPAGSSGVWVGPYVIQPEDGALGVFVHEFAHSLGLPDLYDTSYTGESAVGFWDLMASGSWVGRPLGTEPASLSAWGRYVLGWMEPDQLARVAVGEREEADLLVDMLAARGQNQSAIRVDLPPYQETIAINEPHSGMYEWWSGAGDNLSHALTRPVDLRGAATATLQFWAWYDIEAGWDYGSVQVSTDGGQTWTAIPGNITTTDDPYGQNPGHGITGTSDGWVPAEFDLSAYAGQSIVLRFHYWTDGAVQGRGFLIDDIAVPELGFADDAESGENGWVAQGWSRFQGTEVREYGHYYLLEWRAFTGTDAGLDHVYNFYAPDAVEWFSYNPGLLIWYRNLGVADNNVGLHPGKGMLLPVDAHPAPLRTPTGGYTWRTRVQTMDAAFGRERTTANTLTRYGKRRTYPGRNGVPEFNDRQPYYNPSDPDGSVITPEYGLNITVTGVAGDGRVARVRIGYDGN